MEVEQHSEALLHSSVHFGEVLVKISSPVLQSLWAALSAGAVPAPDLGGAAAPVPQPHTLPCSAPQPCLGVFHPKSDGQGGIWGADGLTR